MKKAIVIILSLVVLAIGIYFLFGSSIAGILNNRQAEQALEAGDYERAAFLFEQVLENSPRDTELRVFTSNLHRDSGNLSRAEHLLHAGRNLSGVTAELYRELSALFIKQDKISDALELLANIADQTIRETLEAERPASPEFSHSGGRYSERISLSLRAGENETIYFSTTGDVPSTEHGLYAEPILLAPGETRVTAVAVSQSGLVSPLARHRFLLENITEPVDFQDQEIELIIRQVLEAPEGRIYTTDLLSITALDFAGISKDLRTLDDLKHLPNLQTLRLRGIHNPCDVSAISWLSSLENLSLDSMGLDSFSLEGLLPDSLIELYLENNGIGPLSPFAELTRLTTLNLRSNTILSLEPLRGLTSLRNLDLSHNAISDVSPLSSLINLRHLNLERNRIESISALEGLEALETLNTEHNLIPIIPN